MLTATHNAVYRYPETVRRIYYSRNYWKDHPVASKQTNDKYLMINAQTEGTKAAGWWIYVKGIHHRILGNTATEFQRLLDNMNPDTRLINGGSL